MNSLGEGPLSNEVNGQPAFGPCVNCKYAFTTSQSYAGNGFGGLAGVDSKCQIAANSAGIGGTYKAWISGSSVSASARLAHSGEPYRRTDGFIVANNWTDLTDGILIRSMDRDEFAAPSPPYVWTGTRADGSADGFLHCDNWATISSLDAGTYGVAGSLSSYWTAFDYRDSCPSQYLGLYCFQQ